MSKRWLAILAVLFSAALTAYGQAPSILVDQMIFSGLVDPQIVATSTSNPDIATLETYLQNLPPASKPNWPITGFRGFLLENNNVSNFPQEVRVFQGVIRTFSNNQLLYFQDVHGLESFLSTFFGPPSSQGKGPDVSETKLPGNWIDTDNQLLPILPTNGYEPAYNPNAWNDHDGIQHNNNCYNYGANKKTGTFAQPGRAGGRPITAPPVICKDVYASAIADGFVPWVAGVACPNYCYKVALVVNSSPTIPPGDYHWLQQNRGGNWSHKPGPGEATNLDDRMMPITDPRTATLDGYPTFCAFMCVLANPNKVKIGAEH